MTRSGPFAGIVVTKEADRTGGNSSRFLLALIFPVCLDTSLRDQQYVVQHGPFTLSQIAHALLELIASPDIEYILDIEPLLEQMVNGAALNDKVSHCTKDIEQRVLSSLPQVAV